MPTDPDPVARVLAEIRAGGGLTLAAAARDVPARNGRGSANASTTFRWATKGIRTPDGAVVRLEAVRMGGRWLTSGAAVARFAAALTAGHTDGVVPPPRSPAERNRAAEAAGKELKKLGS